MMSRRSLVTGLALAGIGRRARARANMILKGGVGGGPAPGISPDGTVIVGEVGGGSIGGETLVTAYGTWGFGDFLAPHDGTNAGAFNMPLLNGVPANPGGPNVDGFGYPAMMRLRVDFGGNLYGVGNDQLWSQFDRYTWIANNGSSYVTGPDPTPTPGPLPTYAPPYTTSPENSTITGGAGSLTTAEGIWSFGAAGSGEGAGGWLLQLNGIPVWEYLGGPGPVYVDQMTVYSNGRMFYHRIEPTKVGWRLWVLHQQNASTGPTAAPVPTDVRMTPSRAIVPGGTVAGTFVANVAVTTSDGSGFTGTLSLSDTTFFITSGMTIIVNSPPPGGNVFVPLLTALQNGSTANVYVPIQVS